jgi:uncharacterized protein YggE
MPRIYLAYLLIALGLVLPWISPAWAAGGAATLLEVDAEGKVMAKPDMATLILEVITQAPQAEAAAAGNARQAEALLKALKKMLGAEEKVQSLSYRVVPVRTYLEKPRRWELTGYKAENRFQVKLRDLTRLGAVIDTALKNGANEVTGPYFRHSRQEELEQQAYVAALQRAKRLAEALAQSQGLKIKSLQEVFTSWGFMLRRGGEGRAARAQEAGAPAPTTPIEVGEQEIRAHIWAVFELAP